MREGEIIKDIVRKSTWSCQNTNLENGVVNYEVVLDMVPRLIK